MVILYICARLQGSLVYSILNITGQLHRFNSGLFNTEDHVTITQVKTPPYENEQNEKEIMEWRLLE